MSFNNAPAGVHRFEFDCERKLAYISATDEDYRGNIVKIIAGFEFPQSNDVFVVEGGLIYMIDRFNGLDILKYSGKGRDRPEAAVRPERLLVDTAPIGVEGAGFGETSTTEY